MVVDLHKAIGKLPIIPKRGFVLPKYNYCGPYNPLHNQLVYDEDGNILRYYQKPTGKRQPTEEELRLELLERALSSAEKEMKIVHNKLNSLKCQVLNSKRESYIDAEYVRIEIRKLTERSIQEIRRREQELLMDVDQLVQEANSTLDSYSLQLNAISSDMKLKVNTCRDRLAREVSIEDVGVPLALMEYQQEAQQTINFLKSNETKFRKRWMGFRPANEPNFKHSVSVLGFVGISDPRVIRPWRNFGSEGTKEGEFRGPVGIDVNNDTGHVIISDFENHRVQIVDTDGNAKHILGSKGTDLGLMKGPNDVKLDKDGRYIVADTFNHRVSWYDSNMEHVQSIGRKGSKAGEFDRPRSLALTTEGNIVVADTGNQRVQVFSNEGEYLFSFGDLGKGDGQFKGPHGIAVDNQNNIYVADLYNHRIQVFDNEGRFIKSFGKEGPLEGELCEPRALVFTTSSVTDTPGLLVVAEMENRRVSLFSSEGQYLCSYGKSADGTSRFGCPSGLTSDLSGRIYVSDSKFNMIHIL